MKRVALVGGGGSGIGNAVARRLLEDGATVVITGRRLETLERAAGEMTSDLLLDEGRVVCVKGDIASPDEASWIVEEAVRLAGPPDVMVLNAGGPPPGRVLDVEEATWRAAYELLLLGPLRLARLTMPGMAERRFGRVVLVTSALVRQPEPDLAVSIVLRSAATAMAKLLAMEFAADGVTVNCVAPGPTATARRDQVLASRAAASGRDLDAVEADDIGKVPARRAGRPQEIADAVGYLVSDAAGFVNGTVLTVDGGLTGLVW